MNLKTKVIDEKGLYRLNQSVVQVKHDFDSLFARTKERVLGNPMVLEMDQRNAKTLEKLQYVIQLLGARDLDLKDKIKEKELVGFGKQEVK